MRLSSTLRASLAAAFITAVSIPAFAEVRYNVETLPFSGYFPALNNQGQVVGYSPDGLQGGGTYLRDGDGQTRHLSGYSSYNALFFINNRGDVAWSSPDGNLEADPTYFYDHQKNSTTLVTPSPFLPGGVNDKGQVSGITGSLSRGEPSRVAVWQASTGVQTLPGQPDNVRFTTVRNINDQGQFLFSSDNGKSYLYTPGQALQALPAGQTGIHINDLGDYIVENGVNGQYQLVHGGVATDLIGSANASVVDLNNQGVALGYRYLPNFPFVTGFVVDGDGTHTLSTLIDPTLDISLGLALDINDRGQILTLGTDAFGVDRTYLLTPVPEPSAALMVLAGGLVAAGSAARRRGRKLA